ncbi:MAG: hypothetical protein NVS3B21_28120 [Acidimicrobiales bacterium]
MSAAEIADVLDDLRRLSDGDPDALAERAQILATKRALIRRLQRDDLPAAPAVTAGSLLCARPGCANPVVRTPGQTGRPPIYCSPQCRPSRRFTRAQITVEVDHDDDPDDVRSGRSWVVKLRRGRHSVTVGQDLGRFAASALSAELSQLLHPRTRQEGGPID